MLTLHQQNVYRRVELGNNGRYANLDMRFLRIYHTIDPYHSHCTNFHIDSLKNYFTQFGEVSECTVMRDSATGRSRGFGFLTFRDPKCVNTVMVKEHYLDGKIVRDVVPPRATN
jgi:RNA recognition motif-containing protein